MQIVVARALCAPRSKVCGTLPELFRLLFCKLLASSWGRALRALLLPAVFEGTPLNVIASVAVPNAESGR